jgi:hypothetical protein
VRSAAAARGALGWFGVIDVPAARIAAMIFAGVLAWLASQTRERG